MDRRIKTTKLKKDGKQKATPKESQEHRKGEPRAPQKESREHPKGEPRAPQRRAKNTAKESQEHRKGELRAPQTRAFYQHQMKQLNNRDELWNKRIQINIHLLAEIKYETRTNKGINKPPRVVNHLPLKNCHRDRIQNLAA